MNPAQRIQASPEISEAKNDWIRSLITKYDIFDLRDAINTDRRSLARELAKAAARVIAPVCVACASPHGTAVGRLAPPASFVTT